MAAVDDHACIEAKYDPENGLLRCDTAEVPEFCLEMRNKQIMKSKKQKVKPTSEQDKFPDPFEDLDDDCVAELYDAESFEHLEEELKPMRPTVEDENDEDEDEDEDAMAAVHGPDIDSLPHGKGLLFQTDGYIATVDGPFDDKVIRSIVKCDMFQMVPCTVGKLACKFELWFNENGQYEDCINQVATAKLGAQAFGGELYGNVLVVRSGTVL